MYVLTIEQMRQAEKAADASGQTFELMMESAGQAVATAVGQISQPEGTRSLILIGPGNNGGDGLVAAYHLSRKGANVTCYVWKRSAEGDQNLRRATEAGCHIVWAKEDTDWVRLTRECQEADVILDALLGTGAARPIEGSLAELLRVVRETVGARRQHRLPWMNEALQIIDPTIQMPQRPERPIVIAVDAPSGLNCDTGEVDPATLPADITVTFGFPKVGQLLFPGGAQIGKLLIAEIGIPPRLIEDCHLHLITNDMVAERLPIRPLDAHKGTFGSALIVGGSVNYSGAPALAASGAARIGAGLVTLAIIESIYPAVASKLFEPTYILLPQSLGVISPEAARVLNEHLENYQAMLIGPGLGREKEVSRFMLEFLAGKGRGRPKQRGRIGFIGDEPIAEDEEQADAAAPLPPLVIDADALNILAQEDEWWKLLPAGCILTPHPGEMSRLTKREVADIQADRIGVVREAAATWKQIVLLKGAHSLIGTPDGEVYIFPFANPALATAGTGDVLAGAIVGLLAQGLTPLDATVVAGFVQGLSADELEFSEDQSAGTVASDLLAYLPIALQRLRR